MKSFIKLKFMKSKVYNCLLIVILKNKSWKNPGFIFFYFTIFISSISHFESANLSMMKRIYFVSTIMFLLKRGS